jgi:hypothetical protein
MIGQRHACNSRWELLGALSRPGMDPLFKVSKARVFFRPAIIIFGISFGLSSAVAEVKETVTVTEDNSTALGYVLNVFPRGLAVHFLNNNNNNNDDDELTEDALIPYYNLLYGNNYKLGKKRSSPSTNEIGTIAPETVWSLDVSTGAHLELSDEFASEVNATVGDLRKRTHLGAENDRNIVTNDNTDGNLGVLLISPPQLEVASCDMSAEHADLDHCKHSSTYSKHRAGDYRERDLANIENIGTITTNNSTNRTYVDNEQSTYDVMYLSNHVTSNVENELINVNTNTDMCLDVSCEIIWTWYHAYFGSFDDGINETPWVRSIVIVEPIDLIDSPTPPDPPLQVSYGGDPTPGSGITLGSTPPVASSTVPETSTWLMIMIGFGIIAAVRKQRVVHSIKRAVIASALKHTKQSAPRGTA